MERLALPAFGDCGRSEDIGLTVSDAAAYLYGEC